MGRRAGRIALALAALAIAACGTTQPAPSATASGNPTTPPSAAPSEPGTPPTSVPTGSPFAPTVPVASPGGEGLEGVNLACIGIELAECRSVAAIVQGQLPPEQRRPFLIQIQLYGCETPPCANSLSRADGVITVEPLEGEPIVRTVKGPPASPTFGNQEMFWLGPFEPESAAAAGPGPFAIDLGHCGLLWKVDFDGSFWLPVGFVDGNSPALISADRGSIRLVDPSHAVFTDSAGNDVQLARHPGAKHLWGCR